MKPNGLFCDGAVLAEGKPIRVFGDGDGEITVRLCGAASTVTARGGKWCATLPAMSAGGPHTLEISGGDDVTHIKDVYVGKVFLVAGQSNAAFQLRSSDEPGEGYRDDALLRNYFAKHPWSDADPYDPGDGWVRAEKEKVGVWSAIAYLAGREARGMTGKAVGVITCAQDASVIESWLPGDGAAFENEKLHPDHFDPGCAAWNRRGVIYEKMLSTLFPFSLNGVIWYQGESDTTVQEGEIYDAELLRFMKALRAGIEDETLPFALIQIADYDGRLRDDPEGWRAIQNAQRRAASRDARSTLIISKDVCEGGFIHPPQKTEISKRAARAIIRAEAMK